MYLKAISIQNYRNLEPVSMALGQGFWAVLGENGQGKSNLLEAVSVLCMGRSRKADRDRDLVRFGESFMRLEGRFSREQRGDLESVVRVSEEGKELLLFGSAVTRLAKFIGAGGGLLIQACDDGGHLPNGKPLHKAFISRGHCCIGHADGIPYCFSQVTEAQGPLQPCQIQQRMACPCPFPV